MLIFVKVLFRQLKTRFFVLIQLIKRLLCCFRNKTDLNENAEEIIGSNFVIVQQNTQPVKNTVMTNIYDQETSLNEWDAMAPDSVRSTQQKCLSSSFSEFSLVNQQNGSQFSSDNIGSKINIGPNKMSFVQQSTLENLTNENIQEPDFFQDMTPKLKKPKKIFVAKETEVSSTEIIKKFHVNNSRVLDLDDSKFKPFGVLDDMPTNLQEKTLNCNASWEDMTSEETSWNELDAGLQKMRRETRQQKFREHQDNRRIKQQNR